MLTDDELLEQVTWPPREGLSADRVRETLRSVRRYVDFDGTIALPPYFRPAPTLCGAPLPEFLAQTPYVCQTWNPFAAVEFFERYPQISRPVLVITVPVFIDIGGRYDSGYGKDFTALGIRGAEIVDDLPPECIRAPGCTLLLP